MAPTQGPVSAQEKADTSAKAGFAPSVRPTVDTMAHAANIVTSGMNPNLDPGETMDAMTGEVFSPPAYTEMTMDQVNELNRMPHGPEREAAQRRISAEVKATKAARIQAGKDGAAARAQWAKDNPGKPQPAVKPKKSMDNSMVAAAAAVPVDPNLARIGKMSMADLKKLVDSRKLTKDELDAIQRRSDELKARGIPETLKPASSTVARKDAELAADQSLTPNERIEAQANLDEAVAQKQPVDSTGTPGGPSEPGGPKEPSGPTNSEPSPSDGDGGSKKSDEPGISDIPRSKIMENIATRVEQIRQHLARGSFELSGNTKVDVYNKAGKKTGKKTVHSDEVNVALKKTLEFLGKKPTVANKRFLFIAFQIYRGMGVDRKGNILNKDGEKVVITDKIFIETLAEMRNNIREYNHPFAYTNPHYKKIGGTESYPTVTTRELAEWFTADTEKGYDGPESRLDLDLDDFIGYNVKQWNDIVGVRLKKVASASQREAVLDMIDAVSADLGSLDLKQRSPNSRISMTELLDADSEAAQYYNKENDLAAVQKIRADRLMQALERIEKNGRPAPSHKRSKKKKGLNEPLDKNEAIEDPEGFWIRLEGKPVMTVVGMIPQIGRIMGVAGLWQLAITSVPEKGIGIFYQRIGLGALRALSGMEHSAPTKAALEMITEESNMVAVEEMLKILASQGVDGLIDAAMRGVDFTHGAARRESEAGDVGGLLGKTKKGVDVGVGVAMDVSTGDWAWKKQTAKAFLDYYAYELAREAQISDKTGVNITPELLEAALMSNPISFFQEAATSKAGRAALVFASNTSLSGVDPVSNALRKATSNSIADLSVGYVLGWYMKFGIRSAIRIIPFSNTGIYAIKRGMIDPARLAMEARGVLSEGSTVASNELMLAGNEEFWSGLAQNTIMDLARFTTQVAAFTFCYALIHAFGGIMPPDDDDLYPYWYEWKIGGQAIRENWYWSELLGFAMPFAVAMHAGAIKNDSRLAARIIGNGLWSKAQDNPWSGVGDVVELINNFDRNLIEAQNRSEGYLGNERVSTPQFVETQLASWWIRRTTATFEPQIMRQIYNEHGLWRGENDLAHSPNVIYTRDPNDDVPGKHPKTEMTTWQDSQLRRAIMPSYGAGLVANFFAGMGAKNDSMQRTGYLRDEMPLISNVDPIQQNWADEFSVFDANGDYMPADKWAEEQKQEKTNQIINLLSAGKVPSDLAANGIVIPMDARRWADEYLVFAREKNRESYYARQASGEWWSKGKWNEAEISRLATAKNDAYQAMMQEQGRINGLIDALWSDEIPYSATKYNRQEENYRSLYTWKEGANAGKTADPWDYYLNPGKVELTRYAAGDLKSSFLPWLTVDDHGANTYDSETPLAWQGPGTDFGFIKDTMKDRTIDKGMFQGRSMLDVMTGGGKVNPDAAPNPLWDSTKSSMLDALTGGGKVSPNDIATVPWSNDKLLFGARGYHPASEPLVPAQRTTSANPNLWGGNQGVRAVDYSAVKPDGNARVVYLGGGGGGGGGSYAPKIYSHPAYSINSDKPAGLYSKTPSYTRFDYLRPKVLTKGSREAYRREDF